MTTGKVTPNTARGIVRHWLSGDRYLAVFMAGIPLSILGNDLAPGVAVLKGQSWAVLLPLVCAALSIALWLRYPRNLRYPSLVNAFLILMAATWSILSLLTWLDGQAVDYRSVLVPLLLMMLVVKPIDQQSVLASGVVLAWAVIAVVVVSEVHAAVTGNRPIEFGVLARFPQAPDFLTQGGRWEGPFLNPNYAGPAAAFLIVFGVWVRRRQGIWFAVIGALMLVASASRSALFGLLVGLSVLYVAALSPRWRPHRRGTRLVGVLLTLLALGLVAWRLDPTLNGRTGIWSNYWHLWLEHPLTGVGTSYLDAAITTGQLDAWDVHGHNLVFDLLGRHGLAGLLLVVATLLIAVVIGVKGAQLGQPLGLALVLCFLAIGLSDVHGSWLYWTVPSAWLLLGVLNAATAEARQTQLATPRQDADEFY